MGMSGRGRWGIYGGASRRGWNRGNNQPNKCLTSPPTDTLWLGRWEILIDSCGSPPPRPPQPFSFSNNLTPALLRKTPRRRVEG
jgi:hypothetical protein